MLLGSTPAGVRGTRAGVALREGWAMDPQDVRAPAKQSGLLAGLGWASWRKAQSLTQN